ncbi:MAG: hypothetical protein LAT55_12085 [Opitutales bacterium]|nr:hypothetical protein [Opitutales bacterium]
MAALTNDRNTRLRAGDVYDDPVAASTVIFAGALTCLNAAGNAVPGATATGLKARGVARSRVDNGGGDAGDKRVETSPGTYRFGNSASADAIGRGDIGATAYIVDDQTVAKTDGSSARSPAGTIVDVDDIGVWVRIGV